MSKALRHARTKSDRCLHHGRHLGMEQLEERRLLSISTPPAAFSLDVLEIDPEWYADDSIIVRFNQDFSLPAALSNPGMAAQILSGTTVETRLGHVPGLHRVTLSDSVDVTGALAAYRNDPRIAYAQPNYRIRIADTYPNDVRFSEMWSLDNTGQTGGVPDADIDAPRAWDVTHGSGSNVVAVIDTGVDYTHPDLAQNMWVNSNEVPRDGLDNDGNGYVDDIHGYDFINHDGDPMDDQGHGTHVAGTIGADGDNGLGVTGINWDVQIMALKFIGPDGWGDESDAIEAIYYAITNGASITNASWGGDPYSQALYDAIATARDADHVFVAAAGNGDMLGVGQDNDATLYYPASYDLDNIVAVSAIGANGDLGSFSNYGRTTVDLAAPGVDVLSTVPGTGYGLNTGTSMAAPHATGVLALVQDLHPEWTYREVIDQVLSTVDPIPELYGLNATNGRLNAAAAVGNPEPASPPGPPGWLPIQEDFEDGVADFWLPQVGRWDVGSREYTATPVAENHELVAVTTLDLGEPLPDQFEIETTLRADEGRLEFFGFVLRNHLTNGVVVFDYHDPEDFKFAGADMDGDRWIIGHRNASGWSVDAAVGDVLDADTDYRVRVAVTDSGEVHLEADGLAKLTHQFSDNLADGDVGLGARDSTTHFDDVRVEETVPDTFGPELVSVGPYSSYSEPVSSLRLTFSEPIDASSFTLDDIVRFSGPSGPVPAIDLVEVSGSNSREFAVSFPAQSQLGDYTLEIGLAVYDTSGNPMNQDGDSVNGEAIEDHAEAVFRIVLFVERFDFGMASTPVAADYAGVLASNLYNTASGHGWQDDSMREWDRNTDGDLLRDFHWAPEGTFLVDVPNGQYEVIVTMGDGGGLHDQMAVSLEGTLVNTITTQAGEYATNAYLVDVNDGQLMLHLEDLGGSNANIVINALEVYRQSDGISTLAISSLVHQPIPPQNSSWVLPPRPTDMPTIPARDGRSADTEVAYWQYAQRNSLSAADGKHFGQRLRKFFAEFAEEKSEDHDVLEADWLDVLATEIALR
jgi:subtilisin family serine protease